MNESTIQKPHQFPLDNTPSVNTFNSYPTDTICISLPKYILLSVRESSESRKANMDTCTEPRTANPHTGQSSSPQPRVPWPKYFVSRPDGTKSPLIAADELPCNISIVGLPTNISTEQTFGMMHVGIGEREPYPATTYRREIARSSSQHRKIKPLRANVTATKSEELKTKDDDLQPQEKHNLNTAQVRNTKYQISISASANVSSFSPPLIL